MYCTYLLLVRVRVDTDTRFSRTIKSRNLYTDEGQMERKGQFSLIGKTAFGRYKTRRFQYDFTREEIYIRSVCYVCMYVVCKNRTKLKAEIKRNGNVNSCGLLGVQEG